MVARVEHALHGSVERRLAARRGDHLCGRGGDAGGARRDLGHGFAQGGNAGELRVVVMAGAHRGNAGLDGLGRRVEIMVADRQHDDVLAGLLAGPAGEVNLPAVLAVRHDAGDA